MSSKGRDLPLAFDDSPGEAGRRTTSSAPSAFERWVLGRVHAAAGHPPVGVELWDGSVVGRPVDDAPVIEVRDRRALWQFLRRPQLHFGDLYSSGRIEVRGDLTRLIELTTGETKGVPWHERSLPLWLHRKVARRAANTLAGSQRNIHHHYDLSNDFYRLWLDERMQYTCAYFPDPSMSLEAAQLAKLDHVCRKLQLKPGDTVFEAGCGWGGLALHMAKHWGADVTAYNISREQVRYANERAREEGLADRLRYVEDDYRNMSGRCDVFVSVGMLEHVGVDNYRALGGVIDRTLRPGGRGLVHSIGRNRSRMMNPWIDRRIFPGAHPPSLREMMNIFEPWNLSVLDVENLRLHYAKTLEHWLERFESRRDTVREMFDERFVRAWRLYLAGSIAAFRTGSLQLFQVVFRHGDDNALPWSREHVYASGDDGR